jgi:hypothetical protein
MGPPPVANDSPGKRLSRFMDGCEAAMELFTRAFAEGFPTEAVVLGAAVIDSGLRIALVLDHQIRTKSDQLLMELLHQGCDDRAVTERQVYRRSLDGAVITKELFDELEALYSERNRVVHRYVISEITTEDVFRIARRYRAAIPKVGAVVSTLERRQIEVGVGMTRRGSDTLPKYPEMANRKHGAEPLARALRRRRP